MSVSSGYTGGHVPVMDPGDNLASPSLPGMFTSKAVVGPDSDGLGPTGPTRAPHLLQQLRAAAEGSWAAPLFSRLQLRLRKCCGRRGRRCPAPRDDRRHPGGRDRRGGSGPGRRPPRSRCTAEDPGPRAAPTHSPGGAQLRRTPGALSPGCGAAAPGAGAAAGGPERRMSVGSLAPLPGVRRARRLDAGRMRRATAVAGRSRRATFRPLLLTALVPGLASLPPPSLPTGWTRFRAELEDRAPGAALRLLRRRMRPPPPLGLPPSGAARGDPGSSRAGVAHLKSDELGDVPSSSTTPIALRLSGAVLSLLLNHSRPERDKVGWRELEAQSKCQPALGVVTAISSPALHICHPQS